MKIKSFEFLFDESKRHSQYLKLYMNYTFPLQPASVATTKILYSIWIIIQINIVCMMCDTTSNFKSLNFLFVQALNPINTYLNAISFPLSIFLIFLFGFFLINIFSVFWAISQKQALHYCVRMTKQSEILKKFNGIIILGGANFIWLALWISTGGVYGLNEAYNSDIALEITNWLLLLVGIFFTIYTLLVFYYHVPFFPNNSLKSFKTSYNLEFKQFLLVMIILLISKFGKIDDKFHITSITIIFIGCCWMTYSQINDNFLNLKLQYFVFVAYVILNAFLLNIVLAFFTDLSTNLSIFLHFFQVLILAMLGEKFRGDLSDTCKAKDLLKGNRTQNKRVLMSLLMDINFQSNKPSENFSKIKPDAKLGITSFPFNAIITVQQHAKICNQVNCACHTHSYKETVKHGSHPNIFNQSVFDILFLNSFVRQLIENYLIDNPQDLVMMFWYLKFIYCYFKNYNFMLCELKSINRKRLNGWQTAQVFMIEEEIIYKWRYNEKQTVNPDVTSIGIFKFVDFFLQFNKIKHKAEALVKSYISLIVILCNHNPVLIHIREFNEKYFYAKQRYLNLMSKIKFNPHLKKFHSEMCRLCIPEQKKQSLFTTVVNKDITGTKIIYTDKSSYLFASLDKQSRGIILHANPNIESIIGFTATNLVGRLVDQLIPSEVAKHHDGFLKAYIHTGKAVFVNRIVELFLINSRNYIVPVTIYLKNFLSCGDSSACVLAFFKMKEDKRDLIFCNPQGKILNITERISSVTNWEKSLGISDAYIQILLPKVHPIIMKAQKTQSLEEIIKEVDKLKELNNYCHGTFYINPMLSNENPMRSVISQQILPMKSPINQNHTISGAFKSFLVVAERSSRSPYSTFKVRFEIEVIMTPLGPFFLLAFSSISPCHPRIQSKFLEPKLTFYRIALLKMFSRSIRDSQSTKVMLSLIKYKRAITKNLLNQGEIINDMKNSNANHKQRIDLKLLEELDIDKITKSKLFVLNILLLVKILLAVSFFLGLAIALYLINIDTFNSLNNSFSISEKRNFLYNFMTDIAQNALHVPIQKDSKGKDLFKTDFPFLPKTRTYSATQLVQYSVPELKFAKIQKIAYMEKLMEMQVIRVTSDPIVDAVTLSNFIPYQYPLTLNVTTSMYDMFVYFNYLINLPTIGYTSYQKFSINAYKITEEYGLDFERQVFLDSAKKEMGVITMAMIVLISTLFIFYFVLVYLIGKIMMQVAYFYSFTSLISVNKKSIRSLKIFIKIYELNTNILSCKMKVKKASNMWKRDLALYIRLLTKAMLVLITLFVIISLPMIIQISLLSDYGQVAIKDTEYIINNILNLDFLVAKAIVGLQDSTYPRRTYARIFHRKFMKFYKSSFTEDSSFLKNIQHLSTKEDLCPFLTDLKFENCTTIYQGVFSKGYEALTLIVLNELTSAHTNRDKFYSLVQFDSFYQLLMGYMHATQMIGESFKIGVQSSVQSLTYLSIIITLINCTLILGLALAFKHRYKVFMEDSLKMSLSLLLHIKPRIMIFNSKLLRIFK